MLSIWTSVGAMETSDVTNETETCLLQSGISGENCQASFAFINREMYAYLLFGGELDNLTLNTNHLLSSSLRSCNFGHYARLPATVLNFQHSSNTPIINFMHPDQIPASEYDAVQDQSRR